MFKAIKQFLCFHDWNKTLSKDGSRYKYKWCYKCGKKVKV